MTLFSHHERSPLEAMIAAEDPFSLHRVTPATTSDDGFVHLVDQYDPDAQRPTMCGRPAVRASPASRIWNRPCRACVASAIRAGFTVVRERSALVNLQRIPSPDS